MSRPLTPLDKTTRTHRAVRLDKKTYKTLREVRDILSYNLGIEIHLNQVIQILCKKHIESYKNHVSNNRNK